MVNALIVNYLEFEMLIRFCSFYLVLLKQKKRFSIEKRWYPYDFLKVPLSTSFRNLMTPGK